MNWTKIRESIDIGLLVVALMLANALFWISWHNLDQLNGYAMLLNDINAIEHCDDNFYDVREIQDCGVIDCPDFQTAYIKSKFAEVLSYILFTGIIGEFLIRKWKKKSQS